MANPTSNFNWQMPTPTDLVTDLPADFEVFGQAVDSSMADLLGGTTGQVLAKNSNTNMDFVWVTSDDANAIQNTIVDAKGDLIAASASDVPARLAVGANGETLVADSSTSTGLRYQATNAAGKNLIINGGMDVWQRGTTTGTVTQAKTFLADRFYSASGAAGLSYTATQSTDKPDGFRYSLKVQRTAGNTTASEIYLWQDIETNNAISYAGKTVTVSFYAKKGANFSAGSSSLGMAFRSGTGTDQTQYYASYTGQADVVTGTATLTTSWQRFSFTGTVATTATELGFNVYYTASGTAGADDSFFITGVQVEIGSVATNFTRTGGSIQGELAACQRYYWRASAAATSNVLSTMGTAYNTSGVIMSWQNPVPMRVKASSIDYSALEVADFVNAGVGITSASADGNSTPSNSMSVIGVSGTPLTQYRNYAVRSSSSSGYVGFSAEL
jgi:hypothetical protein